MTDPMEQQRIVDDEHLRLLSLFYYVAGGITALFVLVPLIWIGMGLVAAVVLTVVAPVGGAGAPVIAWLVVAAGIILLTLIAWLAAFKLYTGYCIGKRRHRVLCLVVAAISLLAMPYGTLLGIFTFIVLSRPSVRAQFEAEDASVGPPVPPPAC